jgi:hypothetical protein
VQYLRQLLVFVGVLPPRIEQLERSEPWLDALLDRLPPNHASVIGPFAQWDVLRRARRRAETRDYTRGSAQADRAKIMNAVKLLKWLDEQHCQVNELTQAMVEAWVGGKRSQSERHLSLHSLASQAAHCLQSQSSSAAQGSPRYVS